MPPLACLNGRVIPQDELHLPLNDAGIVWGATITDLCRTVRHKLYRWPEHLARFRESCRAAGIYPALSEEDIHRLAVEIVEANVRELSPAQDLALVLVATPGPIGYYLGQDGGPGSAEPTLVMHTFPLPFGRYRRFHTQGARLVIPSVRHVPPDCVDRRIKQRSRLHWWLAEQEAHRSDPHASALLLDHQGHVTETAVANFLIVKKGVVVSPPRHEILEGVSLGVVRDLCQRLDIGFGERPLTLHDCLNADEALLTCTSFCLAGVSHINGQPLPWPGPIYQRLLQHWSEEIGLDIREQIMGE